MKHFDDSPCAVCGGRKQPDTTTYVVDLGFGVVVVRGVPASVCMKCGEEWLDDAVVQELERITDEATKRQAHVEVVTYREPDEGSRLLKAS